MLSREMQTLLSVTKFETFRKKAEEQSYLWFQFEQNTKMPFYSLLYFLFFSISCALVFSGSLVFNWNVHIPVCRKCNTVYFFTFTAQILYIFYISARGYDKTDYCLKNYFIHLCSIIFSVVLCTLWKNIIYDID